jgi:hypothetical protein
MGERIRAWRSELPLATLVLFSVAACFAPGPWQCAQGIHGISMVKVEPDAQAGSVARRGQPIRLDFEPDGSRSNRGAALQRGAWIDVALPAALSELELSLQRSAASAIAVLASVDGREWTPLWALAPRSDVEGLVTSQSPLFVRDPGVRFLRMHPQPGQRAVISGLGVAGPGVRLSPVVLAIAFWGLAALALVLQRVSIAAGPSGRLLGAWRRIDAGMGAGLTYLCFFHLPTSGAVSLGLLAVAVAMAALVRRAPVVTLAVGAFISVIAFVALPRLLERVVAAQIAGAHELDVDHRMKPDGNEVNADGLRFRGASGDLDDSDFVVAFLGDSFTYGWELPYEQAYPYVFESVVSEWSCDARVRAVNMAWTSASPLLGLRLLREIGPRYRPDLVVYSLDMTDFQDDLRYEWRLRERGDFEIDRSEIVSRFIERRFAALGLEPQQVAEIGKLLRGPRPDDELLPVDVPAKRFFVTEAPLDETRGAIERGVMQNLGELNVLSEKLGASMSLVVYPRAYQYSQRESARSWDRDQYSVLGPFAREPFRYFEQVRAALPYPVIDLLGAFESSKQFPLFRDDDPHWNAAGSRLAAESVARELASQGLIPCSLPAP